MIDLRSVVGFGQRGFIVAPPKTMLFRDIANAIIANQPNAKLFVLLVDTRPEDANPDLFPEMPRHTIS
jgi:transcription termination factor Rho